MSDLLRKFPVLEQFLLRDVQMTKEIIGSGSYGSVEGGLIPGAKCALKKIHNDLQARSSLSPKEIEYTANQFAKECQLMTSLRHPNIVQFFGLFSVPGSLLPALVMERLLTNLHDLLEKRPDIPLGFKHSFLVDIAAGLSYLHSRSPSVIHRDLSAKNVLLTKSMVAKLADLGMARIVPKRGLATMTKAPGAFVYMPPEALEDETRYDCTIDVFSLGVVAIFILTQYFPDSLLAPVHRTKEGKDVIRSELERRERYMRKVYAQFSRSHPLVTLIEKCVQRYPGDRPNIQQVVQLLDKARSLIEDFEQDMDKLELVQLIKRLPDSDSGMRSLSQGQDKKMKSMAQTIALQQAEMDKKIRELEIQEDQIISQQQQIQILQEQVRHHSSRRRSSQTSSSIHPATVLLRVPDAHENEVNAVCFSGSYMATGGADKIVKVWKLNQEQETLELNCTFRDCNGSVMSLEFDRHSRLLLGSSCDNTARVWDIKEQKQVVSLIGHTAKVMGARFFGSSHKVVTCSQDCTMRLWNLHSKTCIDTLPAISSCNDVLAPKNMGDVQLISAHTDKRVRLWDLRSKTAHQLILNGVVTSLDINSEKNLLLCCSRENALYLIDMRQNSIVSKYCHEKFNVGSDYTRAAFSPDARYVAAGSEDGALFVWELNSGRSPKVTVFKEHSKEIVACAWHPTKNFFASVDKNRTVRLWQEETFRITNWAVRA